MPEKEQKPNSCLDNKMRELVLEETVEASSLVQGKETRELLDSSSVRKKSETVEKAEENAESKPSETNGTAEETNGDKKEETNGHSEEPEQVTNGHNTSDSGKYY